MRKTIRYYLTPKGKAPFVQWIKRFKDHTTRLRIERRIERLELGNYWDCEPVGEGVFELKLNFGPGYRVYFAEEGDTIIVLLYGGNKSTQSKDIQTAKEHWRELRGR